MTRYFPASRASSPPGYRHDYWPTTALGDIRFILSLSDEAPLQVCLSQWIVDGKPETRFKLFHYRDAVPLSDIIPILENLGARTVEEHPYELRMDGRQIWIHDFVLKIFDDPDQSATHLQKNFEEAFVEIWFDRKEND
ncbi:MAG: NAD-glutamate dehydrogenase, partial [Proteobacteria bacterium]|nr:NAD-glutamate dehydrogenase [Pseudomonadota bacterium]